MGGSNGGFFHSNIDQLKNKLNDTDKTSEHEQYVSEVSEYINKLLAEYNDRNTEKINVHLDEITKAIEKNIEGTIKILLGGSVSKHTYVDGLSDIDALVILNETNLEDRSISKIKTMITDMLKERYHNTDITIGKMAVTVKFSDCEIQLLPALKSGEKIKIPDSSGDGWSKIDTTKFSEKLTEINNANSKKVVPVIKLAKAIINNFPEKNQLSGYHIESMAVDFFKDYHSAHNTKSMLQEFFKGAAEIVLSPIKDKTGQSIYVDDYLGKANSTERKTIAGALDRIYRKLSMAENTNSIDIWKDILD